MMKKILYLLLIFTILSCGQTWQNKPLKTDKSVISGKFKNGFEYIIKENNLPKNRAYFYFITKAGSAMENNDQLGLAHFIEHMAFNGSKNFSKNDVIDYLRSIGARFGGDTNAWTSLDQTVYVLSIPLSDGKAIDNAFKIMGDWANAISFNPEDIESERGIILEEWRTHLGADERINQKQWPILFKNSPFANRLPIGDPKIIKSAPRETFINFYEKWYQSQFQAIVAVGDFKATEIEQKITTTFEKIKKGSTPEPKYDYTIPNENVFQVDFDSELTHPELSIIFRQKTNSNAIKTNGDFKELLISKLIHGILNDRMMEATNSADSPFESLKSGDFHLGHSEYFYIVSASYKKNRASDAYKAMLKIIEQARQFGFTDYEMELAKKNILKELNKAVEESDRTESSSLVMNYTKAILSNSIITSSIEDLSLAKSMLKKINVDELKNNYIEYLSGQMINFLTAKEPSPTIPTANDLENTILTIDFSSLAPYQVSGDNDILHAIPSEKGAIDSIVKLDDNITKWTLKNGIEIFIKPTNFKNNEILFKAQTKGGLNNANDTDYISAKMAINLVAESGLGKWSAVELERKLSGSLVQVNPYFTEYSKGFIGSSPSDQLEELFQQLFLYTDGIKDDNEAFNRLKENTLTDLKNNATSPSTIFASAVQKMLYPSKSPRYIYPTASLYETFDKTKALNFYTQELSSQNLSQMQYIFVGSINEEVLRTLVETWLGSLPSVKKESPLDIKPAIIPQAGKSIVKAGIENKSNLLLNYSFVRPFNIDESTYWSAINELLQMRLVQVVREKVGATYSPKVKIEREEESDRVQMRIIYSLDPVRVNEVINLTEKEVSDLLAGNINSDEVNKTKTIIKEVDSTSSQQNTYWLSLMSLIISRELNFNAIKSKQASLDKINQENIKSFLNKINKNVIKSTIISMPNT